MVKFEPNQDHEIDHERRKFLTAAGCLAGGVGALCALTPLVASWMPNAATQDRAGSVTVDLSSLEPGKQLTVVWRAKPIWIVRRTPKQLEQLNQHRAQLRDPDSKVLQQPNYARNPWRSINPEYLVLIGLCTHLGCIPNYRPLPQEASSEDPGGFFCPCHGSIFDLAGRVFKAMPAPINLEVPPHYFINNHTLVIGEYE